MSLFLFVSFLFLRLLYFFYLLCIIWLTELLWSWYSDDSMCIEDKVDDDDDVWSCTTNTKLFYSQEKLFFTKVEFLRVKVSHFLFFFISEQVFSFCHRRSLRERRSSADVIWLRFHFSFPLHSLLPQHFLPLHHPYTFCILLLSLSPYSSLYLLYTYINMFKFPFRRVCHIPVIRNNMPFLYTLFYYGFNQKNTCFRSRFFNTKT